MGKSDKRFKHVLIGISIYPVSARNEDHEPLIPKSQPQASRFV